MPGQTLPQPFTLDPKVVTHYAFPAVSVNAVMVIV